MKTAFIGHRQVYARELLYERLTEAIQKLIDNGCNTFTMGTHGEFDRMALSACRDLRNAHKEIEIEVVITSLNKIKKNGRSNSTPYRDVKTVMYEIETAHYKQQITLSNKLMIEGCDVLICYVDTSIDKSGAKTALKYAEKLGLNIINLYRKEDEPFYGMTKEQADEYWKTILKSCKTKT